ncbi:MAG: metal ABC transporter permease [Pirellulales bacterium]
MTPWPLFIADWTSLDTGTAIVAVATVVACALIGSMLVLRGMSMMGDAIAHAVLPGLVIAFLLTGRLDQNFMLIGAFAMGLLTTWMIQALRQYAEVAGDSAMGVVFTTLFALGVLLSRVKTSGGVDLDADCVLYGSLATIAIDAVPVFGFEWPTSATLLTIVVVINGATLALLWKELRLAAFDPPFAQALGFRPGLLHYLVMALTAVTAVAAFQAVGSILVIAMLIVPAATAHLLTDRLSRMVSLSVVFATLAACCGLGLNKTSILLHAEPAALIAVCAGVIYLSAALFAPRYGLVGKQWERFRRATRIMGEDLLAMYFRLEELAPGRNLGTGETTQSLGGGLRAA